MRKRTQNPLPQKLNGFQKLPRERFVKLVKEQKIIGGEFLLLEFCLAIADWDSKHIKTFGGFDATLDEISEVLGISRSTIGYQMRKLAKKGFFINGTDGRIYIKNFESLVWKNTNPNYVNRLTDQLNHEIQNQPVIEDIQIPESFDTKENDDVDPG